MNLNQIESALNDIFKEPLIEAEQRKIVFWLDKDEEFSDDIDRLFLDGVKLERLTSDNQFYMKHLLEEDDTTSPYLIYTNSDLNGEENWLADTVLYSKVFLADRISLIMSELHIDPSLRSTVKLYEKFFNSKERFRKFKLIDVELNSEESVEIALMSSLCNLKTPDFELVLRTVLMDTLDDNDNKYISLMKRFFDIDKFWKYIEEYYGYKREVESLKTLFMHLSITALSHSIDTDYLESVQDFISVKNRSNSVIFIDRWMHHKIDYKIYNEYARMVEEEIQLSNLLRELPVDDFKVADAFPCIDRAIIVYIANSLLDNLEDYEDYTKLVRLRRSKHYYEKYEQIYDELYFSIKMNEFYKKYRHNISQVQELEFYKFYENEYYLMDYYYRKFYVAYDMENDNELLKKLKILIENLYTNWFMSEVNSKWLQSLKMGMSEDWSLPGIQSQQSFYKSTIRPYLNRDERVYVIISDAMRYEVGVELAEKLNNETIGECGIESMLGVIPSATKLGMAALLPHKEIDIDNNGRVLVDGKNSSGLDNRQKILQSNVAESIAVHYKDIISMNKAERRETVKGKKLIYIYHDAIDAVGDSAATEINTFNAVEDALKQLYGLVKIIQGDLSGININITSDHGFIYQRDALEESDKIFKEGIEPIELKRRYALSKDKCEVTGLLSVNLSGIITNQQNLTAYIPNGTIRYRMQGAGMNYVHGGTSLQEVMIPLLTFKNKRKDQKGAKQVSKVDLKLTSNLRRITNSIFNLEFFQTERVEGKVIPRNVLVYFSDDDNNVLSNEETIIADRVSENPSNRTFKIQFVLQNITYDKNKAYFLIIKDTETGVITDKVPFNISLGFVSDFDF